MLIFHFNMSETYKVALSSRLHFLSNLSNNLCFSVMFALQNSSILPRSFLEVSKLVLILLFQNRSSILLALLSFSIRILSLVKDVDA